MYNFIPPSSTAVGPSELSRLPADAVARTPPTEASLPPNSTLPSSTTLCSTSNITSSPSTVRFLFILTFPSLSILKAFTAALFPSFVANTNLSSSLISRLVSPTPNATSPFITAPPTCALPTSKLFPTTNEFVRL